MLFRSVEWAKGSEIARAALLYLSQPVRDLYALLSNGPAYFAAFSAEAESRFGTIGRAWRRLMDRDFSGAADEFRSMGKNAGDAYNKAFAEASARKVSATAVVASEGADPEAPKGAAGGDGTTGKDREKAAKDAETARAKALAAQNKADQARLNATKQWVKEEGELLVGRNALLD